MRDDARDVMGRCAGLRTRAAARRITRHYDDALRPVGLTLGQFVLLVAIELSEPDTLTDLADKLDMDRTTLTRNLRPLEKAGLVETAREEGRRNHGVRLTDAGRTAFTAAMPLWRAAQSQLETRLGEDGWSLARQSLETIARKL
ncbi:MAG: MarR family winged helix-turn-helix transcriptional regulator [Pseudomonadota bacterium]